MNLTRSCNVKLILIRHTEAVELGSEKAETDFDRYLTPHGIATASRLADTLKANGIEFDAIVSSPLVRAVQTAEPLLALTANRQILVNEDLATGVRKPKKLAVRLNEMDAQVVALVGHRPDLDEFVAWLIGAGTKGIKLAKGTAVKVNTHGEVREGGGTLLWQITPDFYFPQTSIAESNGSAAAA